MRKRRKRYTPATKVAIPRRQLIDKVPISDLCAGFELRLMSVSGPRIVSVMLSFHGGADVLDHLGLGIAGGQEPTPIGIVLSGASSTGSGHAKQLLGGGLHPRLKHPDLAAQL